MINIEIDRALADRKLLGAALGDADTWHTWRATMRAAFGLPLQRDERRLFAKVAGDRKPPKARVSELWAIAGRRSGKSRMAAAVASYVAAFVDHRTHLSAGETGYVLSLSPTLLQARLVFDYAHAFLRSSPILAQQIIDETATEIRLANNIVIATLSNSFRAVRGRTLLAVIFDESAFWRDEASANPDVETYRAVLPALAATNGMLIGISSPYRRTGLLHAKHRDHFGRDDNRILVVQGGTRLFNPTISRTLIDAARKEDPQAAAAEWDGEFRSDLSQFLDDDVIDAAIDHGRPPELPPVQGATYHAFTDASAGRRDAFTLCIGHRDDDRFVADVIRGRKPPFDPEQVAGEYAALAREYRCQRIVGDHFAGEWVAGAFRKAGVAYQRSPLPKSGLYLEALPIFMRGAVSMPNDARLTRELRLLERRTHRSGKDSVDHGNGGSDDYPNVLCGCIHLAMAVQRRPAVATEFFVVHA